MGHPLSPRRIVMTESKARHYCKKESRKYKEAFYLILDDSDKDYYDPNDAYHCVTDYDLDTFFNGCQILGCYVNGE